MDRERRPIPNFWDIIEYGHRPANKTSSYEVRVENMWKWLWLPSGQADIRGTPHNVPFWVERLLEKTGLSEGYTTISIVKESKDNKIPDFKIEIGRKDAQPDLLIIELKMGADEGASQLEDYYNSYSNEEIGTQFSTRKFIFLTPNGTKPSHSKWDCLRYTDLLGSDEEISDAIENSNGTEEHKSAVKKIVLDFYWDQKRWAVNEHFKSVLQNNNQLYKRTSNAFLLLVALMHELKLDTEKLPEKARSLLEGRRGEYEKLFDNENHRSAVLEKLICSGFEKNEISNITQLLLEAAKEATQTPMPIDGKNRIRELRSHLTNALKNLGWRVNGESAESYQIEGKSTKFKLGPNRGYAGLVVEKDGAVLYVAGNNESATGRGIYPQTVNVHYATESGKNVPGNASSHILKIKKVFQPMLSFDTDDVYDPNGNSPAKIQQLADALTKSLECPEESEFEKFLDDLTNPTTQYAGDDIGKAHGFTSENGSCVQCGHPLTEI